MSDTNNLKNTSTDMMVNFLANTEKIVNTDNRWNFGDPTNSANNDDDAELDEDIDQYVSDHQQSPHEPNNPKQNMSNTRPLPAPIFQKAVSGERPIQSSNDNDRKTNKRESSEEGREVEREMTKEELALIKLDTLRKLGELKQCGVHLSQNYGMDSDLKMMQYELKLHTDIRTKQNSVQWMSHMMIGCVKGMEMLNDSYNPFDIKLVGLTDKVSSDMHNYYMVLGDIYEKYNQPGKQMAPEMRLLLMLSGAALSMQASRIIPQLIPQLSGSVKNDDKMLNELRDKAHNNQSGNRINDFVNKEHDTAKQKASDLQTIKDKELEYQRMKQIMEKQSVDTTKNGNKFRSGLILSSDVQTKNKKKKSENDRPLISQEEMKNIQQQKYIQEQQHFEKLRTFANTIERDNQIKEKMKTDLLIQNNKLDLLMDSLEMKDDNSDDNSDTLTNQSTASSVSINPNIRNIMNKTTQSDLLKKDKVIIDTRSVERKNKNKKVVSVAKNDRNKKKNILNKLDDQLDDLLSGEELSFGSNDPKPNDRKLNSDLIKGNDGNKKSKNTDNLNNPFGGIEFSVGSSNKGNRTVLKTGKGNMSDTY